MKKTNGWIISLIVISALGTVGIIIYLFYSKKKQGTTTANIAQQVSLTDVTGKIASLKAEIDKLKMNAWISQEAKTFSDISQYSKNGFILVSEDETNDGLTTIYFSYNNERYWMHSQKI